MEMLDLGAHAGPQGRVEVAEWLVEEEYERLLLGGTLGPDAGAGLAQGAFVGVLTFSAGWAWLGLHLALGRPLAPRPAA